MPKMTKGARTGKSEKPIAALFARHSSKRSSQQETSDAQQNSQNTLMASPPPRPRAINKCTSSKQEEEEPDDAERKRQRNECDDDDRAGQGIRQEAEQEDQDQGRKKHRAEHEDVDKEKHRLANGVHGRKSLKIINDTVHGIIEIGGRCLQILDTPQFQRLRHIHQLQACHYVYPTAQHTRLEHSLGTFHLAGGLLSKISRKQPNLGITSSDIEMVQMAALCHDIGHGAFSHMLDYTIFPEIVEGFHWHHEKRSCEILEYLVDDNNIDVSQDELKTVQSMILGDKSKVGYGGQEGKRYLWDIVANSRHGIDVDKFDYLSRDSMFTGIKTSFDPQRCMELMLVVGDEICFNSRGAESVYDIFHARARLYRQAYFHKATRSIERMIADAIILANPVLNLQHYVHDVKKFCRLDDSIIREIQRSDDPVLEKSREIIKRIEKRQLYMFVDEFNVPPASVETFKHITVDDILKFKTSDDLKAEDLIVQNLKIDYGKGSQDPVKQVRFFDDRDRPLKSYELDPDRVSSLIPRTYQDVTVRLYLKKNDRFLEDEARATFATYQKKIYGDEIMRTPSLRKRYSEVEEGEEGGEQEEDVMLSQTEPTRRQEFTSRRHMDFAHDPASPDD